MNTIWWGRLGDNSRLEPAKYGADKDRPERPQKIRRFQRGPAGFVVEALLLCGVLGPQLHA